MSDLPLQNEEHLSSFVSWDNYTGRPVIFQIIDRIRIPAMGERKKTDPPRPIKIRRAPHPAFASGYPRMNQGQQAKRSIIRRGCFLARLRLGA